MKRLFWRCPRCGRFVAVYKGTDIPKGTLADEKTHLARQFANQQIKSYMTATGCTLNDVLAMTAFKFHLPVEKSRTGDMDAETAKKVEDYFYLMLEKATEEL